MARLQAIEAYRATIGDLPLRVRVLYEGEEEIGSEHLAEFVRQNADKLKADGCIWGRGAVVMKDLDAMILSVIRDRMRSGRLPTRPIVLAFLAGGAFFVTADHGLAS